MCYALCQLSQEVTRGCNYALGPGSNPGASTMRVLLLLLLIVTLGSCDHDVKPERSYLDVDCVIAEKGGQMTHGKNPVYSKSLLLKLLKDTTKYTEWEQTGWGTLYLSDSIFYTHDVGDTLHFDRIAKDRFWTDTRKLKK